MDEKYCSVGIEEILLTLSTTHSGSHVCFASIWCFCPDPALAFEVLILASRNGWLMLVLFQLPTYHAKIICEVMIVSLYLICDRKMENYSAEVAGASRKNGGLARSS